MSKKLISLVISLTFIITIGFKEMVYADTYVSGTVTASLNIRSGPSTSYAILGGFSKGSTIKIVEKMEIGSRFNTRHLMDTFQVSM